MHSVLCAHCHKYDATVATRCAGTSGMQSPGTHAWSATRLNHMPGDSYEERTVVFVKSQGDTTTIPVDLTIFVAPRDSGSAMDKLGSRSRQRPAKVRNHNDDEAHGLSS